MESTDVARMYFDAWNRRDPDGITATFVQGGTYCDPTTGGELAGGAIAAYARGLFVAFPDLAFDIVSIASAGDAQVAAQWVMRGTNTGPYAGGPPTGKSVELAGADFIAVEGDAIRSVRGYFNRRAVVEQLGLQVIVQPRAIGPVSFGNSAYLQLGRRTKPGAVSLTALQVRSEDEVAKVRGYSQRIMQELARMPGFISALTARNGDMMFTVSAWEHPDNPGQLMRGGAHKEAMDAFFGPDFTVGGSTSVWIPHHNNTMWVRCSACGRMASHDKLNGICDCGETLPDHPPYW